MTIHLLPLAVARQVDRVTAETRALFLLRTEPGALGLDAGRRVLAQLRESPNSAIANQARMIQDAAP